MRKTISIAMLALLGLAGCNLDGVIAYAPEGGTVVEAIIKMPDGSIKRVEAKRWRMWGTSIAIDTGDKEFMTSMNNVVMICEHPKKEESK